ncbi:MAG: D-alanyl-D-alanine carboxypeptidase [Bacteroidales bacterium]|nr:D-alanyl-D-alanine carboxypeptidase [Bacteroidales bacterium]
MRAAGKIIAALALCLIGSAAFARNTLSQKLLSDYAGKEPLRSGVVGVLAVTAGGDTLAQLNRCVKLVPASNVKLITTGLGLVKLGPGYQYRTKLAHSGTVRDGVLTGDLYILGGGDPTTGADSKCAQPLEVVFGAFRSQLEQAGINRIEGRVIADPRYFGYPSYTQTWQSEDLGFNYGAGPEGLNFYENAQDFLVASTQQGQPLAIRAIYPETPWMNWTVDAVTAAPGTTNTVYCVNSEFGPWGAFYGSFPADRSRFTYEGSNRFGPWTYAYYLYKYLTSSGISIKGGYGDVSPRGLLRTDLLYSDLGTPAPARESLTELGTVLSPNLLSIVTDANMESDNFFAETVFKSLGPDPVKAEETLLRSMGLTPGTACCIVDGSGLSRNNYVSAEFFVKFLRKMLGSNVFKQYLASLPSPGKGTLKNRMPAAPEDVKARIYMKSGTMNGVRCFSGYILPPAGADSKKTVVFSILTNNIPGSSSTVFAILDELILSLAGEQ